MDKVRVTLKEGKTFSQVVRSGDGKAVRITKTSEDEPFEVSQMQATAFGSHFNFPEGFNPDSSNSPVEVGAEVPAADSPDSSNTSPNTSPNTNPKTTTSKPS